MSPETISTIIAAAGVMIALGGAMFAGLTRVVRRMAEQFGAVNKQLRGLQSEVTEVKIAVARLESSRERLILPRSNPPHFS